MTLITALELAGNYPENILINSAKDESGKFAAFCYMTRDGDIFLKVMKQQKRHFCYTLCCMARYERTVLMAYNK